jgi:hypothetical protein
VSATRPSRVTEIPHTYSAPCALCHSVGVVVLVVFTGDGRLAETTTGEWHTCRLPYRATVLEGGFVWHVGVMHIARKPRGGG